MQVKICGITSTADALAAVEAGADMLGFNFYPPSPRYLSRAACAEIVAALPRSVTTVGVFVNAGADEVQSVLNECGLDLAQLHGDESPADVAHFAGRAFKGLRGEKQGDPAPFAAARSAAPHLLVDAYNAKLYGGTGHTANWATAQVIATRFPILLAGGLTPANVGMAVQQVRPWGVDTASGVESATGRKDPAKVKAFIEAAKQDL